MADKLTKQGKKKAETAQEQNFFKRVWSKIANFFKRVWAKIAKFCRDTVAEMKKVSWTSKKDTVKNTELVLVTVIAVALAIALIDVACSKLINALAGLLG